jgi:hypothetical protein
MAVTGLAVSGAVTVTATASDLPTIPDAPGAVATMLCFPVVACHVTR